MPKPSTVVGTVQAAAPGKAIFIAQGCGACHTFTPAGPDANGQIGPDLDKLAAVCEGREAAARGVHPHSRSSIRTSTSARTPRRAMPEGRHAEVVQVAAGGRSHGSRRLPVEAEGLNLPHDFPRELGGGRLRPRPHADRRRRAAAAANDRRRSPRLRAEGIHVVIVTGRMFQSVRRYALEAGIDDPVVCYQGAVVAEPVTGRWLRHVPIPLELARETIAAVQRGGVRAQLLRRRRALRRRDHARSAALRGFPAARAASGRRSPRLAATAADEARRDRRP